MSSSPVRPIQPRLTTTTKGAVVDQCQNEASKKDGTQE
jgi:hypothetical protein